MSESLHTLVAEDSDAGLRLDKFLATHLNDFSRSRLQSLIAEGALLCDERPVTDTAAKVKSGQVFALRVPEPVASHILPQDIALDIVYEDEHLLVINKPAGLTVHPAPGNPDSTLVNALLAHCGESLSGIGGVARPGIVHRIDKDTTGLLVVAKHDAAHIHLSAQLANRTLKRTYSALVWGVPIPAKGTITGNIGRSMTNRQKMAVVKIGGKPAVTHYRIVASDEWRVASKEKPNSSPLTTYHSPLFSLLECNLETGRTHQIRVHLTYIGHPLIGDPVYGQPTSARLKSGAYKALPEATRQALLGFTRQALHARALELIHPIAQKSLRFEAPLPEDMVNLINLLSI